MFVFGHTARTFLAFNLLFLGRALEHREDIIRVTVNLAVAIAIRPRVSDFAHPIDTLIILYI